MFRGFPGGSRGNLFQKLEGVFVFGITEERMTEIGMNFGITGFILFMLFIIWELAQKSNVGKRGTAVMFMVLGTGMVGFVAKFLIKFMLKV